MPNRPNLLSKVGMILATTYIIPVMVFIYYEGQNSERLTNIVEVASTIYTKVGKMEATLEEVTITTQYNRSKLSKLHDDVVEVRKDTVALRERVAALEVKARQTRT